MNNHYKKYLKYKIKYLKLKNQIGGMLRTDPCPGYTNREFREADLEHGIFK